MAVAVGVVWALIISQIWWPAEARRELGVALSDFLLNMGWLYNRLVLTYSVPPQILQAMNLQEEGYQVPAWNDIAEVDADNDGVDDRTGLLSTRMTTGLNSNIREFMSM